MAADTADKLIDVRKLNLERLFFVLAAVLLLLGVTTVVQIPGLQGSVAPQFHLVAIEVGILSLALSGYLHYVPSRTEVSESEPVRVPVITSAQMDESAISGGQQAILAVFVEATSDGKLVSEQEVRKRIRARVGRLNGSSDGEIYYRLEQLHLLGYIAKKRVGESNLYGLSPEYVQKLGLPR